ncbi:MAG: Bax inhibitor-1/YccA family protein [Microbacteriaceae bacterium]
MNSNPAFSKNSAFRPGQVSRAELERIYGNGGTATATDAPSKVGDLEEAYSIPAATGAQMGRMTVEDTVVKTLLVFGILVASAVAGWMFASPLVMFGGMIGGLVLGLVNTFKKVPSPALIVGYAILEGLFVGGISNMYNSMWDGIVTEAVIGTLGVIGVTLFLFLSGKFRSSARMTKIVTVAMVGYLVYQVVNLVLMITGVTGGAAFGLSSMSIAGVPLGIVIGLVVVFLAAYSLVLDFESIKLGAERGAPAVYAWQGAFGVAVTVVWLYLEILRMLAIARNSN